MLGENIYDCKSFCWYKRRWKKIICVEELAKKGKDIYSVRKQRKKKIDAETEFIFEVAEQEDLGDDRYRVSNIDQIEQHFQMFKKQFY